MTEDKLSKWLSDKGLLGSKKKSESTKPFVKEEIDTESKLKETPQTPKKND